MIEGLTAKVEAFLESTGQVFGWLPLFLVLVQFAVVLLVYVFSSGNIQLQESLQYINAMMFLGGAGYTALHDEHVRVDIFYGKLGKAGKARIIFFGTLFLLLPFLILFWITAVPYVAASWETLETSVETGGLPFVYILKATLLLFAFTLSLHAFVALVRSFKTWRRI